MSPKVSPCIGIGSAILQLQDSKHLPITHTRVTGLPWRFREVLGFVKIIWLTIFVFFHKTVELGTTLDLFHRAKMNPLNKLWDWKPINIHKHPDIITRRLELYLDV